VNRNSSIFCPVERLTAILKPFHSTVIATHGLLYIDYIRP